MMATTAHVIECPICLKFSSDICNDYFVNTSCGHLFHFECIKRCLAIKSVCPSCNQVLTLRNLTKVNGLDPTENCRFSTQDQSTGSVVTRLPAFSKQYYEFKITLLGDSGAGKSCLVKRYMTGLFNKHEVTTVGADIHFQYVHVAGNLIKLVLWDTSGQERFRSVSQNHLRNSHGVLLVYSYNRRNIPESVNYWNNFIDEHGEPGIAKVLVGNMTDIPEGQRTLSTRLAQNLANSYGLPFYETSAKDFYNVETTFTALIVEILSKVQTNQFEYKGPTRETLKLHEKQPKRQEDSSWKKGFKKFVEYIDCLNVFKINEQEDYYKTA